MLEKLVGNLFKPKGLYGPEVVDAVFKYLSKHQKNVEVNIKKEFQHSLFGKKDKKEWHGVSCMIADDTDYHRSRSGYMTYDSARVFTFGKKKWAVAKGYRTGSYPGEEYESDIAAVCVESENPEHIRKALEGTSFFSHSIIVSNSGMGACMLNLFGTNAEDFKLFFDEKINELKDLDTSIDWHSGGWEREHHKQVNFYRMNDIKSTKEKGQELKCGRYHPEIIKKLGDAILYSLTQISKTTSERWWEKYHSEGGNDFRRVAQLCDKHPEIEEEFAEKAHNFFIFLHSYAVEPSAENRGYLKSTLEYLSNKDNQEKIGQYLPDSKKLVERLDSRFKKELIAKVSSFKSIDSYLVLNEVTSRKLQRKEEWWNFPVSYGIVTPQHLSEAFGLDIKTVEDKLKKYNVEVLKCPTKI